ncbi:hypothetical protein ACU4GD_45810 [Cupriavidus basilensis]
MRRSVGRGRVHLPDRKHGKSGKPSNRNLRPSSSINKKCDLPFVDAAHMRFYASYRSDASNRGTWDTGCWAKNIHGDAIIVVLRMPNRTISLKTLARADVQKDGTATIKALPVQGRWRHRPKGGLD